MVLVLKKNDKAPAKYFALFLCLSVVLFVYLVELRNSNPNFNQLKIRSPNISDVYGVIDKPHNRILSDTINSTMAKLPSVINITDQSNSINTVIKEQKSDPEIVENRYTRMSQMLQKFPWEELEQGAENNPLIYSKYRQRLIDELEPFAYVEPIVPVNVTLSLTAAVTEFAVIFPKLAAAVASKAVIATVPSPAIVIVVTSAAVAVNVCPDGISYERPFTNVPVKFEAPAAKETF